MKWKKLGKIFDPTQYKLPSDCAEFAQSPQALVFDDFIRIYFSTRSVDQSNGKYFSHIAFVDMHKNLRDVIRVSGDEPYVHAGIPANPQSKTFVRVSVPVGAGNPTLLPTEKG